MSRTKKSKNLDSGWVLREYTSSDEWMFPEGTVLRGKVMISDSANFHGRFYAGDGCEIHADVILHPDVSLGANAIVGPGTTIERGSMLGDESKLGTNCLIEEAVIIGKRVEAGIGIHIKTMSVVEDDVRIGTEEGGTTIGACSKVEAGAEVQGTLNYTKGRRFIEVQATKRGQTIPQQCFMHCSTGFTLQPEPTLEFC